MTAGSMGAGNTTAGRVPAATILFGIALLAALGVGIVPAGAQNYLHHSLQAIVLVADPDKAADRLERWSREEGGYVLLKASDRVVLRYPYRENSALSLEVEELSEEIVELSRQAVDLREEMLRLQAGIRSREEILQRNVALLDRADVAGTLAIENEVSTLIGEIEELKGALSRLEVDRAYGRAEIAFQVMQQSLPDNLPSSFPWINAVDFYALVEGGGEAGGRPRLSVRAPEGFAEVRGRGAYRAVSPEGMRFRVRTVANEPEKDLGFWSEALESHLRNEGYRPTGAPWPFEGDAVSGSAHEWAVPYGHETYLYLVALVVHGRHITLVETAAPYSVFVEYRQAVRESLDSLKGR